MYTIREELGTVNGLTITMVGDLKNGRTVHSLVRLLSLYSVNVNFVAPPSLSMPESVKAYAEASGMQVYETTSLASVIDKTDVLYVTRVQQERFASLAEYQAVKDAYVINNEVLAAAKPHCIVMHPLPRNAELDPEVDFDQRRAAYFRQMRFGLFVRLSLSCRRACRRGLLADLAATDPHGAPGPRSRRQHRLSALLSIYKTGHSAPGNRISRNRIKSLHFVRPWYVGGI